MTLVIADSGYVVTAYLTEEVRHKMKTNQQRNVHLKEVTSTTQASKSQLY